MAYLNISLSPMSKRVCVCVYTYIPGLSENLNGRSVSTKLVSLECMVAWKDFSASIYQCQLLAFIYPLLFEYDGCLLAGVLSEASDTGTRSSSTDFISDARWKIEFWRYETENELFWYILFFEFDLWGNYSRYER